MKTKVSAYLAKFFSIIGSKNEKSLEIKPVENEELFKHLFL